MGRVAGTPEGNQHRPVIEVTLRYAGRSIPVRALVDSGADFTTIPQQLGELLTGLAFDQIGVASGNIEGMGAPTPSRRLDGVEGAYMGRVFATSIFVGQAPRVVLGRNDFMRTFDLRFFWGHNPPELWIEPTQPAKARTTRPPLNTTIRPKPKKKR